jgi:molybdopterin converting factor small subunit
MLINVKFVGRAHEAAGTSELPFYIPCEDKLTLREFILKLHQKGIRINVEEPGILVLVNGRNSSLLKGFETEIKNNDTVVIGYFTGGVRIIAFFILAGQGYKVKLQDVGQPIGGECFKSFGEVPFRGDGGGFVWVLLDYLISDITFTWATLTHESLFRLHLSPKPAMRLIPYHKSRPRPPAIQDEWVKEPE